MPITDQDNRRDWFLFALQEQVAKIPGVSLAKVFEPNGYGKDTAFVWLGAERLVRGAHHAAHGESECDFVVWLFFEERTDTKAEGLIDQRANALTHEIEKQMRKVLVASKEIEGITYTITDVRLTEITPGFLDETNRGVIEAKGRITYRIIE